MSDFIASNRVCVSDGAPAGAVNVRDDGKLIGYISPEYAQGLREFFLHVRDEQLGRWRWPENPDYVVYPLGRDSTGRRFARAVFEHAGATGTWQEGQYQTPAPTRPEEMGILAVAAYFDAHPEPQPWHTAKEGELWLLRPGDALNELPYVAVDDTDGETSVGPRFFRVPSPKPFAPGRFPSEFVEGRRIWPEPEATS